ncbi:GTP-binding protein [Arabidopsis thaliana]|uniref:GTP-binding protein At2g22870 n=4 Tax=Arabidopsis TaxID=3701 RepID=Y2287_ARATH|nr:P-loop containing nucleoside triphosphate hydrolases superfamily protein [Arabidopsis thaliana]O81004.2 RecName: Full=GTP-binding protein At2g22870; AltName: Full=Protein EMBRYO DEFECTIVE 2001 [Arabidopsis thaliana]KAG7637109.1 EngB-type guanine nucleotide-binding (G) domain [Arabidopsis thaliana x Arabidopsis arenosa]KAG7641728.1 EngB-type guanine nucleotide-binding (G) domain [Arabidopsis suecica]AAC32434.2 putative nucleotide-binding protein [Arabidopsis thaliana]AAM64830.1 putative nucl|eukprot:NP_565543.1 P-loop containing nucleoside triphosphate hydrolases superfamily protein [Arabidopsis thaliana]
MVLLLRYRSLTINLTPLIPKSQKFHTLQSFRNPNFISIPKISASTNNPTTTTNRSISDATKFAKSVLFIPPGVEIEELTDDMVLPGSNIVIGPFAGHSQIKEVEFVKSSARARDCPKDDRPEIAILGRSNVGKSSLINCLVRKKEVALTSKKPGKTQLINHFLVNKSWYIVDLPGYGFAKVSDAAKTDWSAFTKGYFLNRDSLVCVLLLIDASVPPQKIDLDCANWLGRNNVPMTFVFTKCDKMKATKGKRPDENIKAFQQIIRENFKVHPPWILTSSVSGLGRDELLLHMSQLRNYWDQ